MSPNLKLIVVLGATGTQGGSVVKGFLAHPTEYRIRAITRDPSKPTAQALVAAGAEVVCADMNDIVSLKAAFSGAHAIFAYTNFFDVPFTDASVYESNQILETQQGKNLALAAASTPGLEHYLWSSTPSGGPNHDKIRFFNSKTAVTDFIKKELPKLWEITVEIWIGFMYENYVAFNAFFGPRLQTDGKYELAINMKPSSVMGSVCCEDLGLFAHFLLRSGTKYHSQTIGFSAEILPESLRLDIWGRGVKRDVVFKTLTSAEYAASLEAMGIPRTIAEGFADLYDLFDEVGNAYGGEGILQARDIMPAGSLQSWEAYVKKHDWQRILGQEKKAGVV